MARLQYFNFVHESIIFINYFYATVTNSVKKISPAAGLQSSYLSISFKSSLFICVRLSQIPLKNFACGGLSSLLYFNFVHDSINYLCTIVTNVVNKFRLRRSLSLLSFNLFHDSINYLHATVTDVVKNFDRHWLS